MTGKSQHHKGKHSVHSKKSRAIERSGAPAPQQPIVTQISRPVVIPDVSSRQAAATASLTASKTVRYPFITAELKRIGIMAGIILVILVVLALVLS